MRLCTLHIGLPKSASTSLQAMILTNRAQLAAHGIYVPATRTDDYRQPHRQLAWEFHDKGFADVPPGGFKELKAELASLGTPEHILISSEFFQTALHRRGILERLCQTFAAMGYRIRLVAYIRPQAAYINSGYTQVTKRLQNTLDIDDFIADALKHIRYDYERFLLPAVRFDGIDTVYRPFNRETLTRGIVEDFLSTFGISSESMAEFNIPSARNVSPGPKTVAALLRIGRKIAKQGIVANLPHRIKASGLILEMSDLLGWNLTKYAGITVNQAQLIQDRFAPGNDAFAAIVWNRSWADVFGEESVSVPPFNVFQRDSASPQDRSEFDEVVELVWQLLYSGRRATVWHFFKKHSIIFKKKCRMRANNKAPT